MSFFKTHTGYIDVLRICELIVAPIHQNIQGAEIEHIRGFLHDLKSQGFLLVQNEGGDIRRESFSSTPDRIKNFFSKDEVHDYSDLTKRSDDELREIVRRNDNPDIAASLHNRALLELKMRREERLDKIIIDSPQNKPVNRGKTIKQTYKDKDVFIESRSQGGDQHILMGKRDGGSKKAHVIIDEENGSIRLEDNREEPTNIVSKIETTFTLHDGKKITSTRGATEVQSYLPKIEVEKVGFNKIVTTKEGLAESFILTVPVLIKNTSDNKIMIRNVKPTILLPDGYSWYLSHDGINALNGRDIDGKNFLSCKFVFVADIKGREQGDNDENKEYVTNKEKILSDIPSAKIVFQLTMEVVSLEGTTKVDEVADLADDLRHQIKK